MTACPTFPPKVAPCRCDCGYRCGGPGTCKEPNCGWGNEADGKKHFVRDCDHKWDGPMVRLHLGASVSCSVCKMLAISHDEWCGP